MADVDEVPVDVDDDPAALLDADGSDDDDDNELEDSGDESLENLYDAEMVKDQQDSDGPIEDDDEAIVKAMEAADDEPSETLTVKVKGKTEGEFQCQSCFLIKKQSQLANKKKQLCVDCA